MFKNSQNAKLQQIINTVQGMFAVAMIYVIK